MMKIEPINPNDLTAIPQNADIQSYMIKCRDAIRDHKKIMCSISGGYDSDIMLDMIERLGGHDKTTYVFFNTGLEFDATKRHIADIEEKYGLHIEELHPKKSIPTCVKQYGVPFWSKYVSDMMSRLQKHNFQWEDEPFEALYVRYPKCKAALRWWCNRWGTNGKISQFDIDYTSGLKRFIIANPPDFNISATCCDHVKKKLGKDFLRTDDFDLLCTGVRKHEKGKRSTAYSSCFDKTLIGPDNMRPLFWMVDAEKEIYRNHFGIIRSDCYEVWGMKRTGCAGCPFGKNFDHELALAEKYEPKMHKAILGIFGQSYDYTRKFLEFRKQMKIGGTHEQR